MRQPAVRRDGGPGAGGTAAESTAGRRYGGPAVRRAGGAAWRPGAGRVSLPCTLQPLLRAKSMHLGLNQTQPGSQGAGPRTGGGQGRATTRSPEGRRRGGPPDARATRPEGGVLLYFSSENQNHTPTPRTRERHAREEHPTTRAKERHREKKESREKPRRTREPSQEKSKERTQKNQHNPTLTEPRGGTLCFDVLTRRVTMQSPNAPRRCLP